MGFKEDVEVLSSHVDYEALALELAQELKSAKQEIDRLHEVLAKVRKERDELLAREMGRVFGQ